MKILYATLALLASSVSAQYVDPTNLPAGVEVMKGCIGNCQTATEKVPVADRFQYFSQC